VRSVVEGVGRGSRRGVPSAPAADDLVRSALPGVLAPAGEDGQRNWTRSGGCSLVRSSGEEGTRSAGSYLWTRKIDALTVA